MLTDRSLWYFCDVTLKEKHQTWNECLHPNNFIVMKIRSVLYHIQWNLFAEEYFSDSAFIISRIQISIFFPHLYTKNYWDIWNKKQIDNLYTSFLNDMECQIFVNFIGNIGTKNWIEQKILQHQWKINERDSKTFHQFQTIFIYQGKW